MADRTESAAGTHGLPRLDGIDRLRGLASAGIVIIHVMALYMGLDPAPAGAPLYHAVNQAFKFSTQVFVFISGLVLFYGYGAQRFRLGEYLRRRVSGTLVPFLLWSGLYLVWNQRGLLPGLWDGTGGSPFSGGQVIGDLLLGNANYHLYFIFMIFQLYLLYPVLAPVTDWAVRTRRAPALAGALVVAALALCTWQFYVAGRLRDQWLGAPGSSFPEVLLRWLLTYSDRNSAFWLVYFWLGGLVGTAYRHRLRVRLPSRRFTAAAAGGLLALMLAEYGYLLRAGWHVAYAATTVKPLNLLYSLSVCALLLPSAAAPARNSSPWRRATARNSSPWRRPLARMGHCSFGIYLAHPLVLSLLAEHLLAPGSPLYTPAGSLVMAALVYAGSYVLVHLLSHLPLGWLLAGLRPRAPGQSPGAVGDAGAPPGVSPGSPPHWITPYRRARSSTAPQSRFARKASM